MFNKNWPWVATNKKFFWVSVNGFSVNKLKYAYFDNVTLGNTEYKTRYKIAYIDFQSPIGFDTHSIIFKIATKENKNYSELPESN